jgi:hypothetical protein
LTNVIAQLSNPPILQCVALLASLEIFDEVRSHTLRSFASSSSFPALLPG